VLALGNFFGLHQRNSKLTYKPTLGWILTLPTREGSLKHVKTENTQKGFGNEHTKVIFCNRIGLFRFLEGLVGQARGRKHWEMGSNSEIYYEY
jgi:hypothetical protein